MEGVTALQLLHRHPSGYEVVAGYLPREQWDQNSPESDLAPELLHVIEQAGKRMRSRRLARDHRVILQWRELPFAEVGPAMTSGSEYRLQSARTTRLKLTIPYVEPREHGEPTDAPQWLRKVSAGLVYQSWSQPPEHWQEREQTLQETSPPQSRTDQRITETEPWLRIVSTRALYKLSQERD